MLLILAVTLALVLALAATTSRDEFLSLVASTAMFVVWVALTAAVLLCLLARFSFGLSNVILVPIGFFLVQGVTVGYSLLVVMAPESVRSISVLALFDPALFVARNLVISLVVSVLVFRHWSLRTRWQSQVAAQTRSRLGALQARIRPHFLFNTLNTIASLIPERPVQAEQATMDLADLLRSGFKDQASHSLADELELVRGYLRIEGLRLGERLQVVWELDEDLPLARSIPALLLQPLVENAIVHGIARRPEGGVLRIAGLKRRFGRVRFVIENPLAEGTSSGHQGANMALDNIRQRLALAFEQGGKLQTESREGQFRVILDLPAKD